MRGLKRFSAILFPFLFVGVFFLIGLVFEKVDIDSGEKSFTLEDIQVTAALRRDGVLLVRERVTYDFDGTFNVGTRDFDSGPWEIRNIRAFEGDRPLRRRSPTRRPCYEWDIAPASGTDTYELRYEVLNAAIAWPDVVELNWQWVGRDVPVRGRAPRGHPPTPRRRRGGQGVGPWAAQRHHPGGRRHRPHTRSTTSRRTRSSRHGSSPPATGSAPTSARAASARSSSERNSRPAIWCATQSSTTTRASPRRTCGWRWRTWTRARTRRRRPSRPSPNSRGSSPRRPSWPSRPTSTGRRSRGSSRRRRTAGAPSTSRRRSSSSSACWLPT